MAAMTPLGIVHVQQRRILPSQKTSLCRYEAMTKFIKRWQARRKTADELSRLSDRELSDIGIGRGDIPRIVEQAAADWY